MMLLTHCRRTFRAMLPRRLKLAIKRFVLSGEGFSVDLVTATPIGSSVLPT